jgi:hypothetical protein
MTKLFWHRLVEMTPEQVGALAAVDRLDVAVMVRLAVDGKASKSVIDWLLSQDEIEKCGDGYAELRPLHNGARIERRRTL